MSEAIQAAHVGSMVAGWLAMQDEPVSPEFAIEAVYAAAYAHESRTIRALPPAGRVLGVLLTIEAAKRHNIGPVRAFIALNQHEDGIAGWFRDRGELLEVEMRRIRLDERFNALAEMGTGVLAQLNDLHAMLADLQEAEGG